VFSEKEQNGKIGWKTGIAIFLLCGNISTGQKYGKFEGQ